MAVSDVRINTLDDLRKTSMKILITSPSDRIFFTTCSTAELKCLKCVEAVMSLHIQKTHFLITDFNETNF